MTNTFFGVLIVGLLFNLPIYLTNVWYSGHLPFNSNKSYDRYGKPFRVRDVIDDRGNLVLEKYKAYSVSPNTLPLLTSSLCMLQRVTQSNSCFSLLPTLLRYHMPSYGTIIRFGLV
jgi:hypothetical protein